MTYIVGIIASLGFLYACARCIIRPRRIIALDPELREDLQSKIREAMMDTKLD